MMLKVFTLLSVLAVLYGGVKAQDDPILQAPVNSPVIVQTTVVNPRFAPCLFASSDADGAAVTVQDCGTRNSGNVKWTVVEGGAIESATPDPGPITQIRVFSDKCLDLPNGNSADGSALQIWTCGVGNVNQQWQVNGDGTISWAYSAGTKCVESQSGGTPRPVRTAQIGTCGSTATGFQGWNFVPPSP